LTVTPTRILFVDDEANLVLTMSAILQAQGYEVTAVGSVNAALAQIASGPFDVLISDLNIGHPGDGFTVVSAMRRTHPECVTLILTGFPGFDSALEAIRSQVDDYLIKPASIPALIHRIEQRLENPRVGATAATQRISQVLRENHIKISQRVLNAMKSDPQLGALPLSDARRVEFVPRTLEDLATMLETNESQQATQEFIHSAKVRGLQLYRHGYTVALLVARVRVVERTIYDVVHEQLLSLNLSYLMDDLKRLNTLLSMQLEHTLLAFLEVEKRSESRARHESGSDSRRSGQPTLR
jgi:DNA-binding response OmpR family regulator